MILITLSLQFIRFNLWYLQIKVQFWKSVIFLPVSLSLSVIRRLHYEWYRLDRRAHAISTQLAIPCLRYRFFVIQPKTTSLHRSREILYPSEYLPATLEIHTHRDPRCGGAINRRARTACFSSLSLVFSSSLGESAMLVLLQHLRCFVNRRLFARRHSSVSSRSAPAGPMHPLVFDLRPPRAPALPFPSVQSSAVVTSFVREEANVIYEQSRRRRHPNRPRHRRRRRRRRRHPHRCSRRARRGLRRIPIAIPSVPIKLLFSAGALGMRR